MSGMTIWACAEAAVDNTASTAINGLIIGLRIAHLQ
jgi:hypothetical protein